MSICFPEPHFEEAVFQGVGLELAFLGVGEDLAVQEGRDRVLDRACRPECVLFDEGGGGDAGGLAGFCDGDQGFFLSVVELAHLGGEGAGFFIQKRLEYEEDVILIDSLFRGDAGEDVVKEVVDVVGVAFEEVVGESGGSGEDFAAGFAELGADERYVLFFGNPVQIQLFGAVVEGFCGRMEHVFQDVPVASRKDKPTVVHLLDVGAKQGFDVLFGVLVDLLEFVDGEDAGEIGLFQIVEDFLQGEFRVVDVAEPDVEGRDAGEGVVAETSCQ